MRYKAIIFDLDGTLVNSIKDIADAMNTVLQKRNYETYNYKTYKTFVGSGVKSLVIRALPKPNPSSKEINACLEEMIEIYSTCCTNKTTPYQGVLELLDQLKSKNLKLSILSNKEDKLTKKVASDILPDYFNPVLGLKKEKLKKPNPEVALKICQTLKVKPEEVIFVGDSSPDILVAQNAKMLPVGVSWGFRKKEELIDAGAHYILDTPLDLLPLL